ncbi:hypothetical protein M3Y99_01305400 [Aphelenchoides fujianensis]|nr:hypothetical protein M3Y99_01305400 [Aphelenchoides fujianensis]
MASCQHADLLSTVQSVECRSGFVKSPQWPLPFRPAIHFRLKVVEEEGEWGRVVKIVVEGDAQDLKAAIWIVDEDGETIEQRENVDVNANYVFASTPAGHRVFCRMWTDRCAACEERQMAAEWRAALRAQIEELKVELAEERDQAEASRQELHAQLEAIAAEKRKIAAISMENAELKAKAVDSAELNALLEAKCSDLQEELAERSTAMDREVKKLTSRLVAQSRGYPVVTSASAQDRTERLKQKREQLDALKAENERLQQLRQQNGENNENDEVNEQQLAFIFQDVGLGQQNSALQTNERGELTTGQDTQQSDDAEKAIAAQQMAAVQEENRQLKDENEALRLKLAEFERKAAETELVDKQKEAAVPASKASGSSGETAEVRSATDSSDEWERV